MPQSPAWALKKGPQKAGLALCSPLPHCCWGCREGQRLLLICESSAQRRLWLPARLSLARRERRRGRGRRSAHCPVCLLVGWATAGLPKASQDHAGLKRPPHNKLRAWPGAPPKEGQDKRPPPRRPKLGSGGEGAQGAQATAGGGCHGRGPASPRPLQSRRVGGKFSMKERAAGWAATKRHPESREMPPLLRPPGGKRSGFALSGPSAAAPAPAPTPTAREAGRDGGSRGSAQAERPSWKGRQGAASDPLGGREEGPQELWREAGGTQAQFLQGAAQRSASRTSSAAAPRPTFSARVADVPGGASRSRVGQHRSLSASPRPPPALEAACGLSPSAEAGRGRGQRWRRLTCSWAARASGRWRARTSPPDPPSSPGGAHRRAAEPSRGEREARRRGRGEGRRGRAGRGGGGSSLRMLPGEAGKNRSCHGALALPPAGPGKQRGGLCACPGCGGRGERAAQPIPTSPSCSGAARLGGRRRGGGGGGARRSEAPQRPLPIADARRDTSSLPGRGRRRRQECPAPPGAPTAPPKQSGRPMPTSGARLQNEGAAREGGGQRAALPRPAACGARSCPRLWC